MIVHDHVIYISTRLSRIRFTSLSVYAITICLKMNVQQ